MKTRFLVPALLIVAATTVHAQSGGDDVGFEVGAISVISVTGTPTLSITEMSAGASVGTATDNSARYSVTTNQTGMKIIASIDQDLPNGVWLEAELEAPAGAQSLGLVMLGTAPEDVVTGISTLAASNLVITYRLSALASAGVVSSTSVSVTYTITAGA